VTMKKPFTATRRAFTLVVCTSCAAVQSDSILDELRAAIRRCPHGVLVATGCMLGKLTCASRPDGPGILVLLQPCSEQRLPVGGACWVGPINDSEDAATVRAWVERGEWSPRTLPHHLRPALNRMRHAGSRN
jgi:hypothetical protein